MLRLNVDVLCMILEELELQDDSKTVSSCLSIRTLREIAIPIVWKDPWKYLKAGKEKSLLIVLISHISDNSRDDLSQHLNVLIRSPSPNYVRYCKHLNLSKLEDI